MSSLVDQVRQSITHSALLSAGDALLVAVSGGLDSIVLLHVLHTLAPEYGWRLTVAHLNHRLRGGESNQDEAFVRAAARKLRLPFKSGSRAVAPFAARQGLSIEMAARQLRHEFLAHTAAALRIGKIALAHHADDQVELFFLRLFRGAGPEGLAGMRVLSPSPIQPHIQLIRPLLGIERKELETFATQTGLQFRHDLTNDLRTIERNRIRHELLPCLRERYQPLLSATVLRCMEILAAEVDLITELTWNAPPRAFHDLPIALQRRRLRDECLRLGVAPEFRLIEDLRQEPHRKVMIGPRRVLWRDAAGTLQLDLARRERFHHEQQLVELTEDRGTTQFSGVTVSWKTTRWNRRSSTTLRKPPGSPERFDAAKVGAQVWLRHWRPGDRFQPIGMTQPVKVQDLFTNLKIPSAHRRRLLLATTSAGEIFWIEGLRLSERFKMDLSTERCLEWHWQRP